MVESKAATQMIPGAILASRPGSGPIANGNKEITIKKNNIGFTISARWRKASLISLVKTALNSNQ